MYYSTLCVVAPPTCERVGCCVLLIKGCAINKTQKVVIRECLRLVYYMWRKSKIAKRIPIIMVTCGIHKVVSIKLRMYTILRISTSNDAEHSYHENLKLR